MICSFVTLTKLTNKSEALKKSGQTQHGQTSNFKVVEGLSLIQAEVHAVVRVSLRITK
jgi:hypothetical protein